MLTASDQRSSSESVSRERTSSCSGQDEAVNTAVLFIGDTLKVAFAYEGCDRLRRSPLGGALELGKARDRAAFNRCLVEIAQSGPLRGVQARRVA
jgi:hypothetical protein